MSTVMENIIQGIHDNDLDAIRNAIKERERIQGMMTRATLMPNDTVRFSDRIRPKYLVGLTATVVKLNRESIVVNCPVDPKYGRFSGSKNVRCPNDLIER